MRSRPLAARPTRVALALALLTLLALALAAMRPGGAQPALGQGAVDEVVFVGNNWDGTASTCSTRPQATTAIGRINIVPDQDERELEIALNPVDLGYFLRSASRSARATTSSSTTCTRRPTASC